MEDSTTIATDTPQAYRPTVYLDQPMKVSSVKKFTNLMFSASRLIKWWFACAIITLATYLVFKYFNKSPNILFGIGAMLVITAELVLVYIFKGFHPARKSLENRNLELIRVLEQKRDFYEQIEDEKSLRLCKAEILAIEQIKVTIGYVLSKRDRAGDVKRRIRKASLL